jgi:hypothetical protein
MSKKNKYSGKSLDDFLGYTGNQMSEQERNTFERELEKDPFAAEALEGFEGIKSDEAYDDLEDLRQRLYRRLTIRRRVRINRITAAVAAVLVALASLLTVYHDRLGIFPSNVSLTEPEDSRDIITYPGPDEGIIEEAGQEKAGKPEGQAGERTPEAASPEPGAAAGAGETEGPEKDELSDISYQLDEEQAAEESGVEALTRAQRMEEVTPPAVMKRSGIAAEKVGGVAGSGNVLSGVVISAEDSQPLPYVLISVKGTAYSTFTDLQGNFEIPAAEGGGITLVSDFIGMEVQEVTPEDQSGIRITMEPSRKASERVLIEGLGEKSRMSMVETTKAASALEAEAPAEIRSAEPIDGKRRFREYVEDNMVFPDNTSLIRAVVILSFVVDPDGRPGQISVLKSPEETFSKEAIRLLIQGPDWVPGQKNGVYFEEETRIRMVFSQ